MIRSTDDTPMTTAERYASAIGSSNLRMQERQGDLDVIIAAGCLDEGFASALLRLRIEYDLIRGEYRIADEKMRASETDAKRVKDSPTFVGPLPVGARAVDRAAKIMVDAEGAATAAHAMILLSMSTLRLTKEMMSHFAIREAKTMKFNRPLKDLLSIAGQVLDVHIAPTCRICAGRGFNGNLQKGEHQMPCRPCKASGTRRDSIGKSEADRLFASHLLMTMDALMADGERQLKSKRRTVLDRKALINDAEATVARG